MIDKVKIVPYILNNYKPSYLHTISKGSKRGEGWKVIKTKPLKCYECMAILIAFPFSSKTKNSMIHWLPTKEYRRKIVKIDNNNEVLKNGIVEIVNDLNNLDEISPYKTYESKYTLKEIVEIINKNWFSNFPKEKEK